MKHCQPVLFISVCLVLLAFFSPSPISGNPNAESVDKLATLDVQREISDRESSGKAAQAERNFGIQR